jgi:hypothetical protein
MKTAHLPLNLRSLRRGHVIGFVAVALMGVLGTPFISAQTATSAGPSATAMKTVASAQAQAVAAPTQRSEEEKSEAKPNTASQQGVKVHGHWKIDIKNPDGTIVQHREFENSLADQGALLANLLAGKSTSGEAAIIVYLISQSTYNNYGPCGDGLPGQIYNNGVNLGGCVISETSTGYWSSAYACASNSALCSSNLNFYLTYPGHYGGVTMEISGSFVAPAAGTQLISAVATAFAECSSATGFAVVTPTQCRTGTVPSGTSVHSVQTGHANQPFTYYDATSSNLYVSPGQTIQLNVEISFQ